MHDLDVLLAPVDCALEVVGGGVAVDDNVVFSDDVVGFRVDAVTALFADQHVYGVEGVRVQGNISKRKERFSADAGLEVFMEVFILYGRCATAGLIVDILHDVIPGYFSHV